MASSVPMVMGKISWPSLAIQVIIIWLLIYFFGLMGLPEPLIFGLFSYIIIARILRSVNAKYHRQGIRLVMQKKITEAIPYFEKSVAYFSENSWVDKYRSITLLSSVKSSYKEMGLSNIAYCYGQMGDGQKAKEYYKKTLAEFPESGLAMAALNQLQSFEKLAEAKSKEGL